MRSWILKYLTHEIYLILRKKSHPTYLMIENYGIIETVMALCTCLIQTDLVIFSTQAFSLHPACFWFLCVLLKQLTMWILCLGFHTLQDNSQSVYVSLEVQEISQLQESSFWQRTLVFLQFLNSAYKFIYGAIHIQKHVPMFPPCPPLPPPNVDTV